MVHILSPKSTSAYGLEKNIGAYGLEKNIGVYVLEKNDGACVGKEQWCFYYVKDHTCVKFG